MHFVSCMLSGKYVTNLRLHACQQKGPYVTLCACKFSCVSESLFAHQIHLPCLCLVLMSYYHCTSRLGSREVQWSPCRSPAQARAAGHESASATLIALQDGGPGAAIRRPRSHCKAYLSASVPTKAPQGRLTLAALCRP